MIATVHALGIKFPVSMPVCLVNLESSDQQRFLGGDNVPFILLYHCLCLLLFVFTSVFKCSRLFAALDYIFCINTGIARLCQAIEDTAQLILVVLHRLPDELVTRTTPKGPSGTECWEVHSQDPEDPESDWDAEISEHAASFLVPEVMHSSTSPLPPAEQLVPLNSQYKPTLPAPPVVPSEPFQNAISVDPPPAAVTETTLPHCSL
ncbi:hypothetical protein CHUAL_009247 [Chamberlinius hualienensis]